MNRVFFILPNIFEITNGVSIKYIKFIQFLSKDKDVQICLFMPKISNISLPKFVKENSNIKIISCKNLKVPFYREIKIPLISLSTIEKEIKTKKETIIFHGEFVWHYEFLKKLKETYPEMQLFPTWHTDYEYYASNIYPATYYGVHSAINYMSKYIIQKIFSGIIVTGKRIEKKYLPLTNRVFNANEVDYNIFNKYKIDSYKLKKNDDVYNIIYCGRISKEKNLNEMIEICDRLFRRQVPFKLHMIGDGPYLPNLRKMMSRNEFYKEWYDHIIFYGKKNQKEIYEIYMGLDNRIFLFTSLSETFGKTPMEAAATGMILFLKSCENNTDLYIHRKNAFLFDDVNDFLECWDKCFNMNTLELHSFLQSSIENSKKYDQSKIFEDYIYFLFPEKRVKTLTKIGIMDFISFYGMNKFFQCANMIYGEDS